MIPERYKDTSYENVPKDIQELYEKIKETRRGLFIHGSVGSGKTHITHGIEKEWNDKHLAKAIFWNMTELIQEIKADFERGPYDKTRPEEKMIESRTLVFLDDIGAEKMTDFVAETVYRIVNKRYENMLPIIFTSNLSISDLGQRVGDRTASRIVESCDIVELIGGDRRMEKAQKITVKI